MSGLPPAPPPLLPYNKPWLSYQDQIALLQSRGMAVHDVPAAIEFLRHVNYYRFSGYCLVFEAVRHAFNPGTTFEQVRAAYEFDTTLRDIVTEALEVVEVDLRSAVAYWFGEQYGAFGHTNAANFYHRFHHPNWQNDLQRETRRSTELYVSHFKATYTGFPNLPVWVVPELMSFGVLSRMFQGMLKVDRKAVAANYGVQPDVLESWLHHLSYVANLCAHHSRLWDRLWSIKPQPAYSRAWQSPLLPGNNRLFVTLLILNFLMGRCRAVAAFATSWRDRVEHLIDQPPAVPTAANLMGLTATWKTHPLWK